MIQGGDITHYDGTGGESIYGEYYEDELPISNGKHLKHDKKHFLTMANKGRPNTQSSQFFINTVKTHWLDGNNEKYFDRNGMNVIIGKVVEGSDVIRQIEEQGTNSGIPRRRVVIRDSGEIHVNSMD